MVTRWGGPRDVNCRRAGAAVDSRGVARSEPWIKGHGLRLSVALCTWEGSAYLQQQLRSIGAQTRLPDEVVVCDDGSTDDSVAIVERFAACAPFPVTVSVNSRRLGVTGNYARAIARCTGDVIVLGDQDDVWLPHRLHRLASRFEEDPETMLAFSDAHLTDARGRRTGQRLWQMVGFDVAEQQRLRKEPFGQLMGRSIVSGCTLAFRATGRALLSPFPNERTDSTVRVLHDRWISLVLSPVFRVAVVSEPLIEYRLHSRQQVGIPQLQLRKLVPSSVLRWRSAAVPTREHVERLRANVELLGLVRERVAHAISDRRADGLAKIDDAIDHLLARAAIDGSRAARVAKVVREYRTGRYRSYSLGTASAVADAVRPLSSPRRNGRGERPSAREAPEVDRSWAIAGGRQFVWLPTARNASNAELEEREPAWLATEGTSPRVRSPGGS